ncbi:MAG: hypothetical protein Kow00114_32970 [Kiloniellaceae bacterium]
MAFQRKVGTGITAREETRFEIGKVEDEKRFLRGMVQIAKEAPTAPKGWLEQEIAALEAFSAAVLQEAGGQVGPEQSPSWYADQILNRIRRARAAVAAGSADEAAMWGIDIGRLSTEARLKFLWDRAAVYGDERLKGLAASRSTAAALKVQASSAQVVEWQEAANEIWHKNGTLSKSAVAKRIAPRFNASADTIRKKIHRP